MSIAENITNSYKGSIIFKIIHHNHNRGLSAARNTGMEAATGEYIYFLDSDDEISNDCIEKLEAPLSEDHYDLVVGDLQTIGDEALHDFLRLKIENGIVLHNDDIILNYKKKWNMMAQNKLYNASFIRNHQLKFKEGLIHEDELWSFEIACIAKTLKSVQKTTYLYYIRENSITSSSQKDISIKINALKTIVAEMSRFLITHHICSSTAYKIIQKFIDEILRHEQKNRKRFYSTYVHLRQTSQFPLYYRLRANKYNIKIIIQEIHYFLPPIVGECYKYWRMTK